MSPEPSLEARRAELARAAMAKKRKPNDPLAAKRFADLRRDYAAAKLTDHVKQVVATAPPLTADQRDRLVVLLRPGAA